MVQGKKGLITGIANADSIAYGCADKLRAFGADIAVTYLNDKTEKHVRPLAKHLGAEIILPPDVE
jgi:enoyl-[acyl-carrier protein] reductase I